MKSQILSICRYNSWANNRVLETAKELTLSQFNADLSGSFPSVHDTLLHMLWVELLFMRRWSGLPTNDLSHPPELNTVEAIQSVLENLDKERITYFENIVEMEFDKTINYQDSRGRPVSIILWQSIFQCINHSTFHRGQVITKFRQLGRIPPSTDFIVFCREYEQLLS